jgi:hypothetical protein
MKPEPSLTAQESLAFLSAGLIHALSNHLSIVAGNLFVAERLRDRPGESAAAFKAARDAAGEAGGLISRMADFRRALQIDFGELPLTDLEPILAAWCSRNDWNFSAEMDPADHKMPLSDRLLVFMLDAISAAASGGRGRLAIRQRSTGVLLAVTSSAPVDWESARTNLTSPPLAIAYEILSALHARPRTLASTEGGHTTLIEIPFALRK